ncbi:MAG: hypothetical protein ACXAAN_11530 [Candidatus Thorarchaeota archaeon]|jgi:hypothetical protein
MQADFSIVLGDIIVYFIAVFYAVIILTIADIARKKRNLGSEVTRRIVHLFAGAAIWTVPYYPHPWVATLVALTFVIMLGLANTDRFSGFFAAMARPEDTEHFGMLFLSQFSLVFSLSLDITSSISLPERPFTS